MRHLRTAAALLALTTTAAAAQARQAPAPPAAAYATTALDAEGFRAPFAHEGPTVLIDGVMVNGKGPFRFLLDTGASGGGRVDSSLVEALNLQSTGEVIASDGSARQGPTMKLYRLDSLSVGPLSFTGVDVASRDYNANRPAHLGRIDGVLGFHLFREYLLTLDYPARTVTVSKGSLPAPDGRTVLPVNNDDTLTGIDLQLAGKRVNAVIDSGNSGHLTVPGDMEKELRFTAAPQVVGQARTVSGPFEIKSGTLDGMVRIGDLEFINPEITIAGPVRRVNLGARFLAPLALTFDQKNARLRIERPAGAANAQPAQPKRYGLMIGMLPDGAGPIELNGAAPGSIAERAGIRPGDRLVAINGRPIADIPREELPTLFRSSPITLTIERDGATQDIRMSFDDDASEPGPAPEQTWTPSAPPPR